MTIGDRTYKSWAEAFTIFQKYDQKGYADVSAEHDIIYAGPNPENVSDEDKDRLEELGWHVDDEDMGFFHHV